MAVTVSALLRGRTRNRTTDLLDVNMFLHFYPPSINQQLLIRFWTLEPGQLQCDLNWVLKSWF